MQHKTRWTPQKIGQRITLIENAVYQQQSPIPAFRYKTFPSPLDTPAIGADIDDSAWDVINPRTYWGTWHTNFILRTHFTIPADWPKDKPAALYLPLGDSGDFSHPEALAYIDGQSFASADRHHQEILLPDRFRDGKPHLLALHGWTGLGGWSGPTRTPNFICAIAPSCRSIHADARVYRRRADGVGCGGAARRQ